LKKIPKSRSKCGCLRKFNRVFLVQRYISGKFSWRSTQQLYGWSDNRWPAVCTM